MKRLILFLFLFPAFAFSQKVLDVVELSNGEVIVVYDDKTWGYPSDVKKTKPIVQGFVSPNTNTSNSNPSKPPTTTTTRSVPVSSSTSSQCTGKTQKGLRCKRMVKGGGRCYQH